jgi:hypothetical protein
VEFQDANIVQSRDRGLSSKKCEKVIDSEFRERRTASVEVDRISSQIDRVAICRNGSTRPYRRALHERFVVENACGRVENPRGTSEP